MKKIGIILAIIIFILIVCVVLVNLFDVASDDVTIYNEYVTAKKYHNVSMCHTDENCDLNTNEFKSLLGYLNTSVNEQQKGIGGDIK